MWFAPLTRDDSETGATHFCGTIDSREQSDQTCATSQTRRASKPFGIKVGRRAATVCLWLSAWHFLSLSPRACLQSRGRGVRRSVVMVTGKKLPGWPSETWCCSVPEAAHELGDSRPLPINAWNHLVLISFIRVGWSRSCQSVLVLKSVSFLLAHSEANLQMD